MNILIRNRIILYKINIMEKDKQNKMIYLLRAKYEILYNENNRTILKSKM